MRRLRRRRQAGRRRAAGQGRAPRLPPRAARHAPALYLPTAVDGRPVFVVPLARPHAGRHDRHRLQRPADRPSAERADVDYLLAVLNRAFPDKRLAHGTWSARRPDCARSSTGRVRPPAPRARRRSGSVATASWCWAAASSTTYRKTAEKVAQPPAARRRARPRPRIRSSSPGSRRGGADAPLAAAFVAEAVRDQQARQTRRRSGPAYPRACCSIIAGAGRAPAESRRRWEGVGWSAARPGEGAGRLRGGGRAVRPA